MAPQFWIDKRVEILKSRWAANWTAREIGKLLGCSRNAVIGKARRLGLPESVHRVRPGEGKPRVRRAKRARPTRLAPASRRRESSHKQPVELPLTKDEPPSRQIAFTDLKTGECRWISGDDGFCCGHATTQIVARGRHIASPYCGFHSARAYRAPRERPPADQRGYARLRRAMVRRPRENFA
jgi:GcrA cell cycle regulator